MTLMIDLTPETEAKINWNAKRQGISPTDFARRLLENAPLPEALPNETEEDAEGPTLWERSKDTLEAIWARHADGPPTNNALLEEACDASEKKRT